MDRRQFLGAAIATAVVPPESLIGSTLSSSQTVTSLKPMALGLIIQPSRETISLVKQLGFTNCFFSLDEYLGKFTKALASEFSGLLEKFGITATTAEVVGPGRLVWDFVEGPSTIGLVPRESRASRIDALKQASDFAKLLGIAQIQTHCGFIPENPHDPFYEETVLAIREVARHCAGNGQAFLMETGQETPTALARTIHDVGQSNLAVGLDTANLILYGKANPVDAVDILGRHVKSVHAKDGKWPTDPMKLGEEVLIGKGLVDFKTVFTKLKEAGYSGAVTIERETSGPQQIEDVRQEKTYLEQILAEIQK
jgi:L-ribulose-5-phosphate 3-epimerase